MMTILKIFLFGIAAMVAAYLLSVLFIPMLGVGAGLVGAAAGILAAAFAVLAALFAVMVVLAVVLSPVWLPMLAIVGLVSLCKRGGTNAA